ncbi:MAG: hypothetical protein D6748_14055, partial [Calditrichaeota bacterium]
MVCDRIESEVEIKCNSQMENSILAVGTYYYDQDRLLRYGSTTFTYTANGEMQSKIDENGTTTYTCDVFGNLTDVELPDGRKIHYTIDGRNRRVGKAVDGTVEYYLVYGDQINPILQLDADGNVIARFIYGT